MFPGSLVVLALGVACVQGRVSPCSSLGHAAWPQCRDVSVPEKGIPSFCSQQRSDAGVCIDLARLDEGSRFHEQDILSGSVVYTALDDGAPFDLPVVYSKSPIVNMSAGELADVRNIARNYTAAFAEFKRAFNRSYGYVCVPLGACVEEEPYRYRIFLRNMANAFYNQSGNPYAQFGANNFSDYSFDEFTVLRNLTDSYRQYNTRVRPKVTLQEPDDAQLTAGQAERRGDGIEPFYEEIVGLDFLEEQTRRRPVASHASNFWSEGTTQQPSSRTFGASDTSPTSLDWRVYGAVTEVRDQGSCGGCWAFATVGVIEGAWRIAGRNLVSLSEQSLISCDLFSGNMGCNGGVPQYAFHYLLRYRDGKAARRDLYPFRSTNPFGNPPQCEEEQYIPGAIIDRYVSISRDENVMTQFVANLGPIAVAVDTTSWQSYTGGIITNCIGLNVDHAVLIVGYDSAHDPPYWIIKNSWGATWGEDGYVRIGKGTDQCLVTRNPTTALAAPAMALPELLNAEEGATTDATPSTTVQPTTGPTTTTSAPKLEDGVTDGATKPKSGAPAAFMQTAALVITMTLCLTAA